MAERVIRANGVLLTLQKGDITQWVGEAIVNAANERMLGGGGVDGAIHRAAGPELRMACEAVPEVAPNVRCPTGEARITPAYGNLKCDWVIHTVGPIYQNEALSAPLLLRAYRSVFTVANQHKISRIALPAISCGVYGYPIHEAAKIALIASLNRANGIAEITFVLFNDDAFEAFGNCLHTLPTKPTD